MTLIKIKSNRFLVLMIVAFVATALLYVWFIKSPYFISFSLWAQSNLFLFLAVLLLVKITGIVWPPLPAGLFTLGSIPIIGWLPAYMADITGSIIGSSIAYFLGKKYGFPFLEKIFDSPTITKIKQLKVNPKREIEAIFTLRIFTGSLFMEAICYAAGLLKVRYYNFLIGSVIFHLLVGIPAYYLTNNLLGSRSIIINLIAVVIAIPLLIKLKGRYLE